MGPVLKVLVRSNALLAELQGSSVARKEAVALAINGGTFALGRQGSSTEDNQALGQERKSAAGTRSTGARPGRDTDRQVAREEILAARGARHLVRSRFTVSRSAGLDLLCLGACVETAVVAATRDYYGES